MENKIKITYIGATTKSEIIDSCPYSEYIVSKNWFEKNKKLGTSYCEHPQMEKETLKCYYGLTEIIVPKKCPLREKQLIQKIELI